jgi:hypothetical protein
MENGEVVIAEDLMPPQPAVLPLSPPADAPSEEVYEHFDHDPWVVAKHIEHIEVYMQCTRELLAKDSHDKKIEADVTLERSSYTGSRKDKPETFYSCRLPPSKDLESALDFGCRSLVFSTSNAEGEVLPIRLTPGLREGRAPGEILIKLTPGMSNQSYEGKLEIRPASANEMVLGVLTMLRENPERYPIETAVELFTLKESDMKPFHGEVEHQARLNKGQVAALKMMLANRVTIVWGPPGTGKSHLICQMMETLLEMEMNSTLTANANQAIDAVSAKLAQIAIKEEDDSDIRKAFLDQRITRYGTPKKPRSLNHIAEINRRSRARMEKREDELPSMAESMRHDMVSIATVYRFLSHRAPKETPDPRRAAMPIRDVMIIDEVSTVALPLIYLCACFARQKIILVGDDCQLPVIFTYPRVSLETRCAYSGTIFAFLHIRMKDHGDGKGLDKRMSVLTEQRRMPDELAALVRMTGLYTDYTTPSDFKLTPAGEAAVGAGPLRGKSFVMIDTSGYKLPSSQDNVNRAHIDLVKRLVAYYLGISKMGSIGIITPYRKQADEYYQWLRPRKKKGERQVDKSFEHVTVGTVHAYQGSEAPLILWDTVESARPDGTRNPHFYTDNKAHAAGGSLKLLNVAVSRSQARLVVVANVEYIKANLSPDCFLLDLIREAQDQSAIVTAHSMVADYHLRDAADQMTSVFPAEPFKVEGGLIQNQIKIDLEFCQDFIAICSPRVDLQMLLTVAYWVYSKSWEKNILVKFYTHKNVSREIRDTMERIMDQNSRFSWHSASEWPHPSASDIVLDGQVHYSGVPSLLNKEVDLFVHRSTM